MERTIPWVQVGVDTGENQGAEEVEAAKSRQLSWKHEGVCVTLFLDRKDLSILPAERKGPEEGSVSEKSFG